MIIHLIVNVTNYVRYNSVVKSNCTDYHDLLKDSFIDVPIKKGKIY